MASGKAKDLVEQIKSELGELDNKIKHHAYIAALEQGEISREALKGFAGHQYYIIHSDLRSIAALLSRHGSEAGRKYLTGLLMGESAAIDGVLKFAAALEVDEDWLSSYEPLPGGVAYPHYLARLGLVGSDAELAVAFLVNLEAWGSNCGRMGAALKDKYGFATEDLEFFTLFAESPPSFEDDSLAVIDGGLERGIEPQLLSRAARLLQSYELTYWDTMSAL